MSINSDPEYRDDLASGMSGRAIARKYGMSESTVRGHRKRINATPEPATEAPGGESETHSANGSSYVRFSERPWGFEDHREFIRSCGQNPDEVTFTWGWTSNPAGGFWNKLNNVRPLNAPMLGEKLDLPALYAAARLATPQPATREGGRVTCVVWADPQIGKTGRRGGTPELIERSTRIRGKLEQLLADRQPDRIVIADGGDGFEGFESGGNPAFTNDLSLADQMDCYGTELFEWINTAHKHAPVTVMGVTSNHTAWRNGKQNLGRPQDDLGLFMHRQVAKVTAAAKMLVHWVEPEPFDESVAYEIHGTRIGMVHGNQFGPGGAIAWWEKQTFGAQAVAAADILITAHYHSFGAGVAGRNPANGRQRWWLGAPTLDNGSDWFRQTAGRDSDPGLLVFDITPAGFDLGSLVIL